MFTAGTFYQHGQRVFWDVHDLAKSIIIELHDEEYSELIVEVNDPLFAVDQIKGKVTGLATYLRLPQVNKPSDRLRVWTLMR